MNSESKVYRGFNYDSSREYIVYFNDSTSPSNLIVKFPNENKPIRVEYNSLCSVSNNRMSSKRGVFMIPEESHFYYESGWELFCVNDKMLLVDSKYGDIVFLERTDDFQWIKDNYINLPDDIYSKPTFVNFDDEFYVVQLHKQYHRDKDSYQSTIAFWWPETMLVYYPKVIKEATYLDGGTYKATLEYDNQTLELVVPTAFDKTLKGILNEKENGIVTRFGDDGYQEIWNAFKKDSGLKLYYTKPY